mgnify:FL=1
MKITIKFSGEQEVDIDASDLMHETLEDWIQDWISDNISLIADNMVEVEG